MTFDRVAVVGAGLIGGSVALRLRDLGPEVVDVDVVDPDPATREQVEAAGLAAYAEVGPALADRDLVVLAGPLHTFRETMAAVGRAAPGAVVVDLGSTKVPAHRDASAAGIAQRHVGAHPMAGLEQSGFAHARADLLVDVVWAVTLPDQPDREPEKAAPRTLAVAAWLADRFDARVLVTDAAAHDAAAALVSHGPHVLANALLAVLADAGEQTDVRAARHLAAGSFRDGTRVGGRDPQRTLNLLTSADPADLTRVLDALTTELGHYRDDLAHGRTAELEARLARTATDAASLRDREVAWRPCPDLAALARERGGSRAAYLVRGRPGALEWAEP